MEILEALRRTRELLAASDDSDWAATSVRRLRRRLDSVIRSVERGGRPRLRLALLFRGIGSLQDVSVDNGWADEFLELAEVVDAFVRGDDA